MAMTITQGHCGGGRGGDQISATPLLSAAPLGIPPVGYHPGLTGAAAPFGSAQEQLEGITDAVLNHAPASSLVEKTLPDDVDKQQPPPKKNNLLPRLRNVWLAAKDQESAQTLALQS
jgi:hypothetical protein